MRHFVAVSDLKPDELHELLDLAVRLKTQAATPPAHLPLAGRCMALMFEKPSLRTRVSFEAAMEKLGGSCIFVSAHEVQLGVRETIADFARVISQYIDVLVARVFDHRHVVELAKYASVPVINGLSDLAHPCQALADLQTVQELFGDVKGRAIAFIGDGNNVARSLAVGCYLLGARFTLAAPRGYEFTDAFQNRLRQQQGTGSVAVVAEAAAAVREADVVYTDVWTSMGQEAESDRRRAAFARFQVNADLMRQAPAHARLMHCLPAHRGEEVTDDVLDGPQSAVIAQAANRLHAQKALLVWLLGLKNG
jgi:ornithine carbamoyltransferase